LPAPIPGVSLDEKIQVTRLLSAAGANIEQLNVVRRPLSLIKGGGLARACRAGRLVSLIISDVLGDPLEAIASGPTVEVQAAPDDALQVLYDLRVAGEPAICKVVAKLREMARHRDRAGRSLPGTASGQNTLVSNIVLGNNALAVDAAGVEAERLGYSHAMIAATSPEGSAESVGEHLAEMALRMRDNPGPDCLISGGEPTVTLAPESIRGRGGRNQQLALAALAQLGDCKEIALLSASTDGEDGPTDAAGAFVISEIVVQAARQGLMPADYLRGNDAYSFFESTRGLFKTGPTHTNVCDLRVVVTATSFP
jgi:hydroxypyruvate reductase